MSPPLFNSVKIGVIGMGYVGLPLAVSFSKFFPVVGYDIDTTRIMELLAGNDQTGEVDVSSLIKETAPVFTVDSTLLSDCNVYIVTVPTPVDDFKTPNLEALFAASELIGGNLNDGNVVIFESTVFPGVTEDLCGPILCRESGLKPAVTDEGDVPCFYLGYSPERVNPGDRKRTVDKILKVTSAKTPESSNFVAELYGKIVSAGIHKAQSIRIAEAAKVIENTQRDVNIALVNEFALIFNELGIDTQAVLEAAGTKWNFLKFWPGLVGGHCIGVDPYYLAHKAVEVGYNPEIILAGRRLNDNMSQYVAEKVIKLMIKKGVNLNGARVLVLGLAFKENCPDTRNSKVFDMVKCLSGFHCIVDVHDPLVIQAGNTSMPAINLISTPEHNAYDAIILAVPHKNILDLGLSHIRKFGKKTSILFDLKYAFTKEQTDGRL